MKTVKRCPSCGETKSIDDFYASAGYCKACMKKKSAKQYETLPAAKKREYYVAQRLGYHTKRGNKCCVCGQTAFRCVDRSPSRPLCLEHYQEFVEAYDVSQLQLPFGRFRV